MTSITPLNTLYLTTPTSVILSDCAESLDYEFSTIISLMGSMEDCNNLLICSGSNSELLVSATEDFWETVSYLMKRIWVKVHNLGYRIFKLVRTNIQESKLSQEKIMSIWEHSLYKKLPRLERDKLEDKELELFPFDVWVESAKLTNALMEFCQHADRHCSDQNRALMTATMKKIQTELNQVGISVTPNKLTVNYDDWLDTRRYTSIAESGYSKDKLPAVFRYSTSMGRIMPNAEQQTQLFKRYEEYLNNLTKEETSAARRLKKSDPAYKVHSDRFGNRVSRMGFCYSVMGVTVTMLHRLTKDAVKLFDVVDNLIVLKD